jgi:hypothetical protein
MKTRGWRRELAQDMKMPLGYGLAWVDWSRQVAVCYPRPANWLVRQWREFVWRVTHAACAFGGPGPEEQQVAEAQRIYRERQVLAEEFATGYLTGWQECIDACIETIEQQVERGGLRKVGGAWCSLPAKTGRSKTQADPHADKEERTKLN